MPGVGQAARLTVGGDSHTPSGGGDGHLCGQRWLPVSQPPEARGSFADSVSAPFGHLRPSACWVWVRPLPVPAVSA